MTSSDRFLCEKHGYYDYCPECAAEEAESHESDEQETSAESTTHQSFWMAIWPLPLVVAIVVFSIIAAYLLVTVFKLGG